MIDKRLNYLKRKVKDVKIVDTDLQEQKDCVEFGALVTIEDEDENQRRYRLVDKEEIDPDKNWISVQSPMGKALLGHSVDDDFELHLPKGIKNYEVIAIHYGPDPKEDSE
jgi:transcription elongation factor GreB